MARNIFAVVVLTLTGIASAKKATFVPRSAVNKALMVRGGDHLDPTDTAKLGMILAGGNAALTLMSPSRTAEVYGVQSTPMTDLLSQWQGITVLGFCLQAWKLIVKGSDLKTSVAAYCVPWTILLYKTFWNEDHKKVGYSLGPQMVGAVLAPLTLYACLMDALLADLTIKLTALWAGANGLLLSLAPGASCEAYGVEVSDTNKSSMKTLGFVCAGSAVFQTLTAFTDMDPVQAFGFAWIPALLMQISNNFITKETMAKAPSYFWILVDVLMVTVCGFEGDAGEHRKIHSAL